MGGHHQEVCPGVPDTVLQAVQHDPAAVEAAVVSGHLVKDTVYCML